jgi:diacylglycerol kinase
MSSFTFTGRLRSVRFALQGIRTMLASQHNAWVHLGSSIAVLLSAMGSAAVGLLIFVPHLLRWL